MGSEGKSRKRRSSDSPSQDEDERSSRKHSKRDHHRDKKTRKDDAGGRDDKSKKREKKTEKSHKHSRSRERKEKKSGEKHKTHIKNFQELCEDDYFSKNNEFSMWLKEEKGIYFSDLSAEAARDLFLRFIKDWNKQKLESQYYEGVASGPRTAHNWKIRS